MQPVYANIFLPRINTWERLWFENISEEHVSGCVSEKQVGKQHNSGKRSSCAWVVADYVLLWHVWTSSYAKVNWGIRLRGGLRYAIASITADTAEGPEHSKQEWLMHLIPGQWRALAHFWIVTNLQRKERNFRGILYQVINVFHRFMNNNKKWNKITAKTGWLHSLEKFLMWAF